MPGDFMSMLEESISGQKCHMNMVRFSTAVEIWVLEI